VLGRADLVLFTACADRRDHPGDPEVGPVQRQRVRRRLQRGVGVFHSHGLNVLFAILLIVTLVSSGSVWLEGADRTQAIASLDSVQSSWGVSRPFFEWVTLGAFGAMVALGVAFWVIGAQNVRRGLLAPATAERDAP
jgi:hypothetical protein